MKNIEQLFRYTTMEWHNKIDWFEIIRYLLSMISCDCFAPSEQTTIIGNFVSLIVTQLSRKKFTFKESTFICFLLNSLLNLFRSIRLFTLLNAYLKYECVYLIVLSLTVQLKPTKQTEEDDNRAKPVECFGNSKRHMLDLTFQWMWDDNFNGWKFPTRIFYFKSWKNLCFFSSSAN